VWNLLEGHGDLVRVKARHLKRVPGRKTEVKDGAWIAQLLQYGLLRARVVPSPDVRPWRERTRHCAQRIAHHTSVVNRSHTTRADATRKCSAVIRDMMGVSGRRMRYAMAWGPAAIAALGALGAGRLRAMPQALPERVRGQLPAPHGCMLATLREQGEFLEQQRARLAARLEARMRPCAAQRRRLASIDGLDAREAQNLLAALGPAMAQLPDAAPLASWAGMAPGNDESAGQRRSGKTTQGKKWLRRT
jgi:transposase